MQILTIIHGVFSKRQKYSNMGAVSLNILVLLLFPKKGELIFGRDTVRRVPNLLLLICLYFME